MPLFVTAGACAWTGSPAGRLAELQLRPLGDAVAERAGDGRTRVPDEPVARGLPGKEEIVGGRCRRERALRVRSAVDQQKRLPGDALPPEEDPVSGDARSPLPVLHVHARWGARRACAVDAVEPQVGLGVDRLLGDDLRRRIAGLVPRRRNTFQRSSVATASWVQTRMSSSSCAPAPGCAWCAGPVSTGPSGGRARERKRGASVAAERSVSAALTARLPTVSYGRSEVPARSRHGSVTKSARSVCESRAFGA